MPRIESLQQLSEHYNADPYSLSSKVRKRFREEKKVEKLKQKADDELKGRYGLPETLSLVPEDDESRQAAKDEWDKGVRELESRRQAKRQRTGLQGPLSSSSRKPTQSSGGLTSLRARILENTARRSLPRVGQTGSNK